MPHKLLASICFCLTVIFLSFHPALAQDSVKIGTMNLQKVLAVSKTGQAARASVKNKFEQYQSKLLKQQEAVMALKEELDKKSAVWSDDVKTDKQRELKRLAQALEDDSKYAENDMKDYEQGQVEPILKELEKIIIDYGKNNGYSLILDISKGVLYDDESLDVSEEIAAELDKRSGDKKSEK